MEYFCNIQYTVEVSAKSPPWEDEKVWFNGGGGVEVAKFEIYKKYYLVPQMKTNNDDWQKRWFVCYNFTAQNLHCLLILRCKTRGYSEIRKYIRKSKGLNLSIYG